MPEVVGAFLGIKLRHDQAYRPVETRNCSRGGLAQQRLEFAVRQLDGIKIRRVLRQVAQRRPRLLDRLTNAENLVNSQVIHDNDVVTFERRNQALLDISQKHLAIHWSVDHHRRGHFVVTQRGHEGDRLPCPKRNVAYQSDAARSPAAEPHHIGAHRGLVDKHQPGGVKHALLSHPTSPRADHVCSLPFRRLQAFFLKVMSCRPKKRESALRLVRIPRLRSSASVSFKVRSGRSAFNANIRSACASNGETLPPRGFGAALRLSSQRCSHRTAELALTPICSAASRRDAPISTLSITRSRMSPEYDFGIASPRTRESMHADSLIRNSLGIPVDSNRPGTPLVSVASIALERLDLNQ